MLWFFLLGPRNLQRQRLLRVGVQPSKIKAATQIKLGEGGGGGSCAQLGPAHAVHLQWPKFIRMRSNEF
jgi:hypothetical protein